MNNNQTLSPAPVQESLAPIVKSLTVSLPVETAFRLFTAEASRWWPLKTHSVGGDDAVACVMEEKTGGRFYEVNRDGSQSDWGRITAWEPPNRLVTTFHPGRTAENATEVEVTFAAESGGTRVTLTHRGWERCSSEIQAERKGYDSGWDYVLGKYVASAAAGA
jgi:uncharacterized protein YndB with AHSA1/START domain